MTVRLQVNMILHGLSFYCPWNGGFTMKKFLAIVLTLIMVFTAISVISASAVETPAITYTDHLDANKDKGYD